MFKVRLNLLGDGLHRTGRAYSLGRDIISFVLEAGIKEPDLVVDWNSFTLEFEKEEDVIAFKLKFGTRYQSSALKMQLQPLEIQYDV